MDYKSLIQNGQSLQHSGVKGMKWGRRKVRAIGEFGKEYGKAYINENLHPVNSQIAKYKLAFKNGKKGAKYLIFSNTTSALGYRNKVVEDRIAAKKQYKLEKDATKELYKKYGDKDTYKVAKMLNKTRYKKRLREAGGDFASYVKQKKMSKQY